MSARGATNNRSAISSLSNCIVTQADPRVLNPDGYATVEVRIAVSSTCAMPAMPVASG